MSVRRGILSVATFALCACVQRARPVSPGRDAAARRAAAPLESLLVVGESTYYRGQYDSVRVLWLGALDRARQLRDSVAEARLVTWLGLVAWRQGDYKTARRLGEQALALKLQLNLTQQLFKSYNALGLLAWNEARLRDAVDLFGKAADAARVTGDDKGLATVSGNLALVHTDLGDFAAARAGFRAARDGGHRIGDARLEGNALTNLGMLNIRSGDPLSAIAVLGEARQRYRTIHYATGEQNALGQLGTAYDALGEPRLALAALDSALADARAQGLRQDEASDLEALARIYQEAGDVRRALGLYADAKTINTQLGLDDETGADFRSEAEIHAALGDLDVARRYAAEARAIHHRIEAHVDELGDLLLLADVSDRAGRRAESRTAIAAAHRMAAALEARSVRTDIALAEARIADRAADGRGVLRALALVRTDVSHGSYDTEWEAAALLCRAYARLGQLEAAAAAGREAVAAVERVRSDFSSGLLRTGYLSGRAAAYADLVSVLARRHQLDQAFEVSDAARGRALLERFVVTRDSTVSPSPNTALSTGERLLRRIDQLAFETDSLERELAPHPDSAARVTVADFRRLLSDARSEYETLALHEEETRTPATALLGRDPVRAGEVRASLKPDEALIEYLIATPRVLIFVVTADGVRMFTSPVSADNLASRVRLARDFLANPAAPREGTPTVLSGLYEALIGPAARAGALGAARRLIIVPQGAVTYLPFAALRDETRGRFLVQEYALTYLPSAGALPALRRRSADSSPGGPVAAVVLAPDPETLPATRGEALAVAHAVPGAQWVVGRGATEGRLRQALAAVPVVHVAGHGVMNAANPLFSRIEVARGNGASDDDGGLEVHEVLDLRVASTLVFLSGCETGLGTSWSTAFMPGEDYTTLAQAFLYAGARNVIATLWPVEDEGAAIIAERFYQQLRSLPPADALAAAQREMLADPRYRAPYYWAPYSFSGSGERVGVAQGIGDVSVR